MSMEKKRIAYDQLDGVAEQLLALLPQKKVFTFNGPLGAGKTTLVQKMLKKMGITEPVQSPTYTYVSVYTTPQGQKLYHFDLYRLTCCNDFTQAGFDEYLYQPDSWCFIEWPEVIDPLLKEQVCAVTLDYAPDDTRFISICFQKGDGV